MRAAWPATRAAFPRTQISLKPLQPFRPCVLALGDRHPADPFIAGQRREPVPNRPQVRVRCQHGAQISVDLVNDSGGDSSVGHGCLIAKVISNRRMLECLKQFRIIECSRQYLISQYSNVSNDPGLEHSVIGQLEFVSSLRGFGITNGSFRSNQGASQESAPQLRSTFSMRSSGTIHITATSA